MALFIRISELFAPAVLRQLVALYDATWGY